MGPPAIMLIAMPQVVPNSKSMYELAAMQELEKAVELSSNVDLQAALAPYATVPGDTELLPVVTPTVGDLLMALGADRFPARAHNMLGALCTDHGQLERLKRTSMLPLPST